MVAKSGNDGFVCFVQGNNNIFLPKSLPYGYADGMPCERASVRTTNSLRCSGILTEYLLLQALRLSPRLLLEVRIFGTLGTEC